jgi:acetolactate synthase I/II/III large subunit
MNGAQSLVTALIKEQVEVVFGYPGGAVLPIYDVLYDADLTHILVRHEQGAALAADGYARVSGKVGVCLATSGPGATNLITGIANAYLDSVPMVAITGNAPRAEMGRDAFQEVDFLGITMPIVKHNFLVLDPNDLADVVHRAFHIARSGRPGPVVIDVPKDVLLAIVEKQSNGVLPEMVPLQPSNDSLNSAQRLLETAQRPLVYGGGGIGLGNAVDVFRVFVEENSLPTVLTLKGLGALPTDHPLLLGMLGMHGSMAANLSVQQCDLLICVGARFDDRVTGHLERFAPDAKVIHLDVDPAEFGKRRKPDVALNGDIRISLQRLRVAKVKTDWVVYCQQKKHKDELKFTSKNGINAKRFLYELSRSVPTDSIVTADVGQHQMWVAQYYKIQHPNQHLSSGGLGTMGFGLPAAIGAQFARPESLVINVSGDGGVMMNIQELATIFRYQLPVKVIVIDNSRLGMVRQWQELFLERRYSETDLSDNPDFANLARAFQVPAIQVRSEEEVPKAIQAILSTKGALLVHVVVHPENMVWPIVPPGCANQEAMEAP